MGLPRLVASLACLGFVACQSLDSSQPEDLRPTRSVGAVASELRPTPGSGEDPPTFDAGDMVEQYDSGDGFFRVHYTRKGRHAVPGADQNKDGTPDYVQTVADDYDEVLAFYQKLGYRAPLRDQDVPGDHGGDDRFDVYLLDFPTSADGQFVSEACTKDGCSGFMRLENDFNGRNYPSAESAIRLVSSHEFFHAVQAAYQARSSTLLAESTAVWASEAFDADSGDLERQVPAYLKAPDRTLTVDPAGTFDGFTYGAALFFQCLDERVGRDAIRQLWEGLAADGGDDPLRWPQVLDKVLADKHKTSLADVFAQFAERNLFTASRNDPAQGYAHGDEYPPVVERSVQSGFAEGSVRVFPLAARYYTLRAFEASQLVAAADLTNDPGAPGISLVAARERSGKIDHVEREADEAGHVARLDVESGDTLHVVVFNTRDEGESLRPRLCIGSDDEVTRCRAGEDTDKPDAGAAGSGAAGSSSDEPAAGSAAAGSEAPDAGAAADSGTSEPAPASTAKDEGGCNVQQPRAGAQQASWLALALAYALRRRKRQVTAPRRPSET